MCPGDAGRLIERTTIEKLTGCADAQPPFDRDLQVRPGSLQKVIAPDAIEDVKWLAINDPKTALRRFRKKSPVRSGP
jgi:hypothetical protein